MVRVPGTVELLAPLTCKALVPRAPAVLRLAAHPA
jgi:hypothetical protein